MTDRETMKAMFQRARLTFDEGKQSLEILRSEPGLTCAVALFLFDDEGKLTEVRPYACEDY